MTEPTWTEKLAEWKRLSRIGWLHMSVDQFKDVLQALNELLVSDSQWQQALVTTVDRRDAAYNAGYRHGAALETSRKADDYKRGYAAGTENGVEQACKAVCWACAMPRLANPAKFIGGNVWMHELTEPKLGTSTECEASVIRSNTLAGKPKA